jgi:hypothetical protein
MIESELKKLTPSARKAVLALEKQNKADEEELRGMYKRTAAREELTLCGILLGATSTAWLAAKELLEGYLERMVRHCGLVLEASKGTKLNPSGASDTAAVNRHMARVADNYSDRAVALERAIVGTRKAMAKHCAALGGDEYFVTQHVSIACKDWETYVGKWMVEGPAASGQATATVATGVRS